MKILYLAKHDSGGNDDEGAITHALEQLGHRVERLRESRAHIAFKMKDCDFLLCHHCHYFKALQNVAIPKVFWCFDLIDYPKDSSLAPRNAKRKEWARGITSVCDLGFLTDGDWVAQDQTGKLRWLQQGFDERLRPALLGGEKDIDILFTGISRGGGREREAWISRMKEAWQSRFVHVEKGTHREELATLVSRARVVACPNSPVTDRYCSNRVWNMAGLGACVVHPVCESLESMAGMVWFYPTVEYLDQILKWLLSHVSFSVAVGASAREEVLARHTYRHRCAALVGEVERCILK